LLKAHIFTDGMRVLAKVRYTHTWEEGVVVGTPQKTLTVLFADKGSASYWPYFVKRL
jgi:hypothetical protein